ncbi:MAG: FAD-dependent oxidoreductase [Asgard group archaeon]|nr:FAD-dependent oxidoreductase [Asgard group archaeon]
MSEDNIRIGVYICNCGSNIASTVNCAEVTEYARTLPHVAHAENLKYSCSKPSQMRIQADILEHNLNRVIVASCSPRMHEETFRNTIQAAGLNKYLFEMANIREHVSWVTDDIPIATKKAKDLVRMAVNRAALLTPLDPNKVTSTPRAVVVGAGIAGITASLALGKLGFETALVERKSTIGGVMAQLDKTFPTQDCSACILTPKMAEVGDHPNVTLYSNSEVTKVSGYVGNFDVEILKHPRYVDPDKCTSCGDCVETCPSIITSEFDEGIGTHKAIHIAFPQAVPQCYIIDKKGIPPCRDGCPADIHVQGYVNLISKGKYTEALELIREEMPFPSVCGRICSAHCEGECSRGLVDDPVSIRYLKRFVSDYEFKKLKGKPEVQPIPKTHKEKIAIVGGGPAGLSAAWDLVKRGYNVTVFEKNNKAGGLLQYAVPDYRLPKELLDLEIQMILDMGVELKTGYKVGQNEEFTFDQLKKRGLLRQRGFDAVIVATGASGAYKLRVPGEDDFGEIYYGINFLKDVHEGKIKSTKGRKIIVVGGGNVAIDTSRICRRLGATDITVVCLEEMLEMPAYEEEIEGAIEEGIKIINRCGVKQILGKKGNVSGIETLECTQVFNEEGQFEPILADGTEEKFEGDMLIIAIGQYFDRSIVPKDMVDANNQLIVNSMTLQSDTHPHIFVCGEFYYFPESVIEAIASGKWAGESVHRYLRGLDLSVGRRKILDIQKSQIYKTRIRAGDRIEEAPLERANEVKRITPQHLGVNERVVKISNEVVQSFTEQEAMDEASRCLYCANCGVCKECVRTCEALAIIHDEEPKIITEKVGAIVLATGFKAFDPSVIPQYHYKDPDYPDIITGMEFERYTNAAGPTEGKLVVPSTGKKPKTIAFINCVGSRDLNYHEYCSRYCCTASIKHSFLMKNKYGNNTDVLLFYKDIRTFGKGYEELYNTTRNMGVEYIKGVPSDIRKDVDGEMYFDIFNADLNKNIRYRPDLIVLQTAMEPQPDSKKTAETFGLSCSADGFFIEKHIKLGPVETASAGKFIAGACRGPIDITDSVSQGAAAALYAAELLRSDIIEKESITAKLDDNICIGCGTCVSVCPFGAFTLMEIEEGKMKSSLNEILCEGCGACAVACPSGALSIRHYTDDQIKAMIKTAFDEEDLSSPTP